MALVMLTPGLNPAEQIAIRKIISPTRHLTHLVQQPIEGLG